MGELRDQIRYDRLRWHHVSILDWELRTYCILFLVVRVAYESWRKEKHFREAERRKTASIDPVARVRMYVHTYIHVHTYKEAKINQFLPQ